MNFQGIIVNVVGAREVWLLPLALLEIAELCQSLCQLVKVVQNQNLTNVRDTLLLYLFFKDVHYN